MKATIDGIKIEGTPEEVNDFILNYKKNTGIGKVLNIVNKPLTENDLHQYQQQKSLEWRMWAAGQM